MKIYFKTGNGSFFGMDVLPEDTMEQILHKIQDKGWNQALQRKSLYGRLFM